MGHVRLGNLPRTRKWQQVVGLIDTGAATPEVAAATLDASKRGLEEASQDTALVQSFWLLTQLPLCAREPNYPEKLREIGITVSDAPTLMELVGGFSDSVDAHVRRAGGRTDLGEMAQMGAAETLAAAVGKGTATLFGTPAEEVRRELSRFATRKNFSSLARDFFARLTERYLTYFLSRELSNHLSGVAANQEFREALALHCRQASRIVEEFAGGWFSKANFEGGIDQEKAAGFVQYAMKKLRDELEKGAEGGKR